MKELKSRFVPQCANCAIDKDILCHMKKFAVQPKVKCFKCKAPIMPETDYYAQIIFEPQLD